MVNCSTIRSTNEVPVCWQVAASEVRISHVRAPASVLFPQVSLRLITAGRSRLSEPYDLEVQDVDEFIDWPLAEVARRKCAIAAYSEAEKNLILRFRPDDDEALEVFKRHSNIRFSRNGRSSCFSTALATFRIRWSVPTPAMRLAVLEWPPIIQTPLRLADRAGH